MGSGTSCEFCVVLCLPGRSGWCLSVKLGLFVALRKRVDVWT